MLDRGVIENIPKGSSYLWLISLFLDGVKLQLSKALIMMTNWRYILFVFLLVLLIVIRDP